MRRNHDVDPNFTAGDALLKAAKEAQAARVRGIVGHRTLPGGCVLYTVPAVVWQRRVTMRHRASP